jgi:hypothetical protein
MVFEDRVVDKNSMKMIENPSISKFLTYDSVPIDLMQGDPRISSKTSITTRFPYKTRKFYYESLFIYLKK